MISSECALCLEWHPDLYQSPYNGRLYCMLCAKKISRHIHVRRGEKK